MIVIIVVGCEEVVELNHQPEQRACLNCVLNPDSLVRLSLHYTRSLDDNTDFVPIADARILFYENGQEWAVATYDSAGLYSVNRYPQIGKTYSLTANIPGKTTLYASTTVPERPDIDTTVISKEVIYNPWEPDQIYQIDYEVAYMINDQPGKDYYWNCVSQFTPYYNSVKLGTRMRYESIHNDHFNRDYDSGNGYYYYHFFIRQTDDGYDGEILKFTKNFTYWAMLYYGGEYCYLKELYDIFFNADEHYDRYLKSSVKSWMLEQEVLPIHEPVQIYSNITNGLGVFGSASFTVFDYTVYKE